MKSIVSILVGLGCVSALGLVSACGDSGSDDNSSGGAGGASAGGSAGGGKASGGTSSGGSSSSGGASNGGSSNSGGTSSGGTGSGGTSNGGSGGANLGGFGGGLGPHTVCSESQDLADERQAELNCENGTGPVEIFCETLLVLSPDCVDEFEALQDCMAAEPLSSFECDEAGALSAVDGTCAAEQTTADDCANL